MRHIPLLLALLLALPAAAQDRYLDSVQTAAAGTEPSLTTDGMSLIAASGNPIRHFWVMACAASGQTLSGAGHLRAWVFNVRLGAWARNPDLDLEVTDDRAGEQCGAWTDLQVGFKDRRRVHFVADGVTVSGGTTITISIEGDVSL